MKKVVVLLGVLTLATSCGTLFTGTSDNISFMSDPRGAKVFIRGMEKCTTPCSVSVSRSISPVEAQMKLNDHEIKSFELTRSFNGVCILNLLSILHWGVDAATGAIMKYDAKNYYLILEKK